VITTKLLTRLPEDDYITHYTNGILRLEGGLALGYNSERFFAGMQIISSSGSYNQGKESNVVEDNHLTYQIFTGYRFHAPRFLKNALDKADEKKGSMFK
jgi:Domain of unknown function (DUF4421)